jgi:hypothetical protein
MMLLNDVVPNSCELFKFFPWRVPALAKLFIETEEQESRQSHRDCFAIPLNYVPAVTSFGKLLCRSLNSIRPSTPVIDVAHMPSLRGLFVWKQKATTDAPGTYSA